MTDPKPTTIIHGSGNDTTITVGETACGKPYTFDNGPELNYVVERHGEEYAREMAEKYVPDWEEE